MTITEKEIWKIKQAVDEYSSGIKAKFNLDWSVLFFVPFSDATANLLLDDVANRRLYKRLRERSFASLGSGNVEKLKTKFNWKTRVTTLSKILDDLQDGILHYVVGAMIALSPWLFGFASGGAETWVPFAIGISGLLYSLMTNYELGLVRIIPMSTHLALDIASGCCSQRHRGFSGSRTRCMSRTLCWDCSKLVQPQ